MKKINNKGVTLVELIVSFAIVGVAVVYFYQTVSTVSKLYKASRDDTNEYAHATYVLRLMDSYCNSTNGDNCSDDDLAIDFCKKLDSYCKLEIDDDGFTLNGNNYVKYSLSLNNNNNNKTYNFLAKTGNTLVQGDPGKIEVPEEGTGDGTEVPEEGTGDGAEENEEIVLTYSVTYYNDFGCEDGCSHSINFNESEAASDVIDANYQEKRGDLGGNSFSILNELIPEEGNYYYSHTTGKATEGGKVLYKVGYKIKDNSREECSDIIYYSPKAGLYGIHTIPRSFFTSCAESKEYNGATKSTIYSLELTTAYDNLFEYSNDYYTVSEKTDGDWIVKFNESGTIKFNSLIDVGAIIIGGGGGGASSPTGSSKKGGAGGAGGSITSHSLSINEQGTTVNVIVGEGGAGGKSDGTAARSGSKSTFSGVSASGGGAPNNDTRATAKGNGGNGGNGTSINRSLPYCGTYSSSNKRFNSYYAVGGAGGSYHNGSAYSSKFRDEARESDVSDCTVPYSSNSVTTSPGGKGGTSSSKNGKNGRANTGSGGGGAAAYGNGSKNNGGNGGSGVVIIYEK